MAYFDNLKNRTTWQKDLRELKQEKIRRQKEGYVPKGMVKNVAVHNSKSSRVKITFNELVELEQKEIEKSKSASRTKKAEFRKAKSAENAKRDISKNAAANRVKSPAMVKTRKPAV